MSADGGGGTLLTEGVEAPQGAPPAGGANNQGQGQPQNGSPAGGASSAAWRDLLADAELRNDPSIAKYENLDGLAKGYLNAQKLISGERVARPRDDDDAEGWDRWYKATGRPEKPDEYEFKIPDSLPEGFYDLESEKAFRTWAHENGLNKRQTANLHERFVTTQLEKHHAWQTSQTQEREKGLSSLRREWGSQYDAKMAAAKRGLQAYADPDYFKYLEESGKGNDPREVRAWAKIGEKLAGEQKLVGQAPHGEDGRDPAQVIKEYRAKYNDALHKKEHPDHEARVEGLRKLYDRAYGA